MAQASCVFFAQGRCRNGAACPFSHDGEKPLCLFYASPRGCKNGAACPFRHEDRPASNLPRYGQAGRGRAGAALGPPPGEPQLLGPKPAKKKRRKHDPRDVAAAQERTLLARAATPAATRPPPWYAGGAKANEGNGFIACVGVGRSRIVEFCWPETCAAILATCRRGASDVATVWSALATPKRVVTLATAYVWRASQRARVASQGERAASQRYLAELQAAQSRSSRLSLRAPPPVRSARDDPRL